MTNQRKAQLMIATGLLLVTVPSLINHYIHVPDAILGFMMGLGITIEIFGVVKKMQAKKEQSS